MRITKTKCILIGASLLGVGFFALIQYNSETAPRGNARTLYRPSSFPIEHRSSDEERKRKLAALEAAQSGIPQTPPKHPETLRNVGGMRTPPPPVTAPLERIAYVKELRRSNQPLPKELILFRAVAVDGATLRDKTKQISLNHIRPVPLRATCVSEDGERWQCGVRARTALRAFIRQKRVTCSDLKAVQDDKLTALVVLANMILPLGSSRMDGQKREAMRLIHCKKNCGTSPTIRERHLAFEIGAPK